MEQIQRDVMNYDVVIVGAGPSGLSAAIHLKQLANASGRNISVCILEKGSEVGAHLLSGAVLDPKALSELIPNWKEKGAPVQNAVKKDKFVFLTEKGSVTLPTPPQMRNHDSFIISLSVFGKWLAGEAEALGVEIYAGFPAVDMLYDDNGAVKGVLIGDMGIDKHGNKTAAYQPGIEIHAKQTIIAEGCRGSLTKKLFEKFDLRKNCDPQTYGLGIKEVWEIPSLKHERGLVVHTIGWPLESDTYGGSWMYHMDDNLVSIGFVVGLDYKNPFLSPFNEMQRFKMHPTVSKYLKGGKRIAYGARAISEGGWQSLPKLTFKGGVLVGDTAGFLNVPRIKGNHTAMKSGMLAAEALFEMFKDGDPSGQECSTYKQKIDASWLKKELYEVRNIRPSFHFGLWMGMIYSFIDTYLFFGKAPWTLRNRKADHDSLNLSKNSFKPPYPKPDGVLTFDRLSSVFLSNTNHEEDQPCHLKLKDPAAPLRNLKSYAEPAQRYCPAGVYEFVKDEEGKTRFQINAQNCVHCKTCDIKDPEQNIDWTPPQGGGGPNYSNM